MLRPQEAFGMAGWGGRGEEYFSSYGREKMGATWLRSISCKLKLRGLSCSLAQALAWEEGREVNGGRLAQKAKALLGLSGR